MRVRDAERSINRGLRALPWRSYLIAMWLLCNELSSLYAAQLSEMDRPLLESTMDLVRNAATTEEQANIKRQAKKLDKAWGKLIKTRDGNSGGGLLDAWVTFHSLTLEIADNSAKYYGSEWIAGPAIERWKQLPDDFGVVAVDPDEQVDDDSLTAQTLNRFISIIRRVSEAQGPEWDPASFLN